MRTRRRVADVAARLREAGFRVTAPRVAVLGELERNRSHPNPLEVHRVLSARHPSLSLSTVYLTIEAFAKAGLLRRMPARDGHLRVDGVAEAHDHAVCRHCGDVFDLPAQASVPRAAPRGLPRGTRVLGARIEYDVRCARCQAQHEPIPGRRRRAR
jgi:Fur family transcriptional regulator, peroxide stress response regulator